MLVVFPKQADSETRDGREYSIQGLYLFVNSQIKVQHLQCNYLAGGIYKR